ncbi:MAG TPA: hypothetical protein VFZ65_22755 [Planctomycetota bacterium]|nr:hypothetical protein [Planctomycetota bacterium]
MTRSSANAVHTGRAALLAACAAVFGGEAPAQTTPVDPKATESVAQAVERWLASDQASRETLDETVKVLLQDPEVGFARLARLLPAADEAPADARSKGVHGLVTHAALEFLRRQYAREVVYVGQYAPLLQVRPYVTDWLFGLLLATPEWYPSTHRVRLVRPLRELQPAAPDAARVDQVIAIVENAAIEPEDLRRSLACMLWQWGRQEFARPFLEDLQRASTEGDAEDRVRVLLELADLQYELRDYRSSAATHRSVLVLATSARIPLRPATHYSCACVHALVGDVERGIAALQRCAELQTSPDVDRSLKLKRSLFETDPEIDALRHDERFAAILARVSAADPARLEAIGR